MDCDEKSHRRGIEGLVDRLSTKGYDIILMNPSYCTTSYSGELDILAIRKGFYHYYEVKVRECPSSLFHAINQISRVKLAFPKCNIRGIYYPLNGSPKRIGKNKWKIILVKM